MMQPLTGFWSSTLSFASWTYRSRITMTACIVMIAVLFFTGQNSPSRHIFFLVVLPFAGFGVMVCWRLLRFSTVLTACGLYLLAMTIASAVDVGGFDHEVWAQSYLSLYILLFVLIVAGCVASHDDFVEQVFLLAGIAVAISAALNIYLYFEYLAPPGGYLVHHFRLVTSIGMPAYANSTNISATYAVFCIGTLAVAVRSPFPALVRAALMLAAAVLCAAVLLTQARGAILALFVGATVLVLTQKPTFRRFAAGAAVVLVVLAVSVPVVFDSIFVRGVSYRPEIWAGFLDLIAERPWFGYGSFSPAGIVLSVGVFINQAHNLVLSAWFRGGVVSALSMAFILGGGLYWTRRFWLLTRNPTPLCVMATITVAGMVDYQLLATYPTWPWVTFWLPFGLCVGAEMVVSRSGMLSDLGYDGAVARWGWRQA